MDKIAFLNELTSICHGREKSNFDAAMIYDEAVNLYYEALCIIQDTYGIHDKILVSPFDFESVNGEVSSLVFAFSLSDLVKVILDCTKPLQLSSGICKLEENPGGAGYLAHILKN